MKPIYLFVLHQPVNRSIQLDFRVVVGAASRCTGRLHELISCTGFSVQRSQQQQQQQQQQTTTTMAIPVVSCVCMFLYFDFRYIGTFSMKIKDTHGHTAAGRDHIELTSLSDRYQFFIIVDRVTSTTI